jgi:uncharacterized protein YecA (UPF0149 family)
MQEDEVSSLITEEIDEIEDESLRKFIDAIVQHERANLDHKFAEFNDKYDELVERYADNQTVEDIET